MKVAVFINCHRFVCTDAENCLSFAFVRKVHTHSSVRGLDVDECNMMFRCHRMRYTADFHLYFAIIDACYNRNMFFSAGINGVGNKFLHFLSAAYERDT